MEVRVDHAREALLVGHPDLLDDVNAETPPAEAKHRPDQRSPRASAD